MSRKNLLVQDAILEAYRAISSARHTLIWANISLAPMQEIESHIKAVEAIEAAKSVLIDEYLKTYTKDEVICND